MGVPKLRFINYTEAWRTYTLGELTELSDGTHFTPNYKFSGIPFWSVETITKNADVKFISEEEYQEINKRCNPKKGDILITRISSGINSLGVPKLVDWDTPFSIYVSVGLIKASEKFDSRFLVQYINTPIYKKDFLSKSLLTATPKKINMNNLATTLVKLPSLYEQKKIGSFFEEIDKKIQLKQEKVDLLKTQKKGFIQKFFSQELRFKDSNEQEFPDWQNYALGTLGVFGTSYSYSRASEGQGFIQHIHYGDIHSTLPTICEDVQFPTITEQREWEFIREGDILFADASEDYKDLGKAILIKSLQSEKTVAGLHTHKFTPNELIEPLYLIYVTQTKEYREFIKKMGTGVSVLGISKTNLAKFNVLLPSLSEQKKIGEFLFSLDKKIQALITKKEFLNQQKQALMQQMFV